MNAFKKATRAKSRLRMGLCGPSGSGKTYTALRLAYVIAEVRGKESGRPGRVAVIDSENGSASKYVGESPDGLPWDFDVVELVSFSPDNYASMIGEAARAGYDVLVIDSLTHAWDGKDGALDLVDKKKAANSFTAWKDVTPLHRKLVEAILTSPMDVICTLRAKTEYVLEPNEKGQMVPRKIGLAPIQRQGMEYEFDVFADIDQTHILTVTKSRCQAVDGLTCVKPGAAFIRPVIEWLTTGVATEPATTTAGGVKIEDRAIVGQLLSGILTDAVRIGWDRARLDAEVKQKYGMPLDEITTAQVEELARRLGRLPSKVREPVTEVMDVPPKRASRDQLAHIKTLQGNLFDALGGKEAGVPKWRAMLDTFGVDSATKLTEEQAARFITAVTNETELAKQGGEPFTNGQVPATADAPAG